MLEPGEVFVIVLFILAIIFCNWWINFILRRNDACINNEEHNWRFDHKSTGSTGDLGFGISSSWEIDYYVCTKCGKKKEKEIY